MKIKILFIAILLQIITISLITAQQRVKVNRWASPVFGDFTSIPESKSTDDQLIAAGYTSKIFQYEAFLTRPAGNNVAIVNRWEMPYCKDFILIAEHEIPDAKMIEFGYHNKQFVFYAYRTKPVSGAFVAVNRWVNALPAGNSCKDFTLSIAEHELTDEQLTSFGYTSKLVQFFVPDPRQAAVVNIDGRFNDLYLLTMATLYPNANFQGTSASMTNVGSKTLSELGLSTVGSIKVGWGYKAIIRYGRNLSYTDPRTGRTSTVLRETREEIIGDREGSLPNNITSIEIVAYTPLNGWVDMHTHPMSHLGWGGKVFHGAPDIGILVPAIPAGNGCRHYERANNINDALSSCRATHGGYGLFSNECGDDLRKFLLRQTESKLANGTVQSKHHEEGAYGYPDFKFWPAHNDMTHQQMWIDWIKRAYDNGLRTMVSLAVNNASYAAGFSGPGDRNPDDVSSANIQIDEMKRLVNRHNGSAGSVDNWMEIAYSAADLRRIVASNKLAVILGIEVDNIGNFNKNASVNANTLTEASRATVVNEIQRLYNQGIRYIFPIHVVDNKFGGTAVYEPNFNFSNYHQTGNFFDVVCANQGDSITKSFPQYDWILGLAGAKMGVDIARRPPNAPSCSAGNGHKNRLGLTPMGEFAVKEMMKRGMLVDIDHMSDMAVTMTLNLAERFNYPINSGHNGIRAGNEATERGCKVSQYQRIAKLGGMAGLGTDGATAESFRDGYTQLRSVMSYKGVAIGTDVNGFARLPVPPGFIGINYDASFPMCRTGNRSWNYNDEGVAHYGLMADFLKDVRGLDRTGEGVINHLNRSPEYFAQMWEKCERQRTQIR